MPNNSEDKMFHPSTQKVSETDRKSHFLSLAIIGFVLCLGLWLVVIKPLGPGLSLIPGDLGDSRFNEVILEHFYRWASGLDKSYWDARFFYPFPLTTAFSDNLLGSAPIYAVFRWAGTDRETALQVWYIFGYALNFIATAYVLRRFRFSSLAVAFGAFFFTFGLPVLAQENHFQLLYRFGVPLAGYFLWAWAQKPTFKNLILLFFFVVLQFYLTIYTGFFLLILLFIMALLIPFACSVRSVHNYSLFWPRRVQQTWLCAERYSRIFGPMAITALLIAGIELFLPYYKVTRLYGFTREWIEIAQMMPRPRSYFLADRSLIWKPISNRIGGIEIRWEHQLFPGIAVVVTVIIGILWRFRSESRKVAFLYLAAFFISVVSTLQFHGHSLYELVWWLPGISSIRAITRIQLVMMWPLAFFIAYTFDALLCVTGQGKILKFLVALLLFVLMISESSLFDHYTFSKQEAQNRLTRLDLQQVTQRPAQPILFVAAGSQEPFWASEIDGMLLAQQYGWDTLNGYSGNFPPGFKPADSCAAIPRRIINSLNFTHQYNRATYLSLIHRVIPIGFSGCDPKWWKEIPDNTE